jgi:hypothetical protein
MERAITARHGVELIGELIAKHGESTSVVTLILLLIIKRVGLYGRWPEERASGQLNA